MGKIYQRHLHYIVIFSALVCFILGSLIFQVLAQVEQLGSVIDGEIHPKEEKVHKIPVDPVSKASFVLMCKEGDLSFSLTTPSGKLITPSAATKDSSITYKEEEAMQCYGYEIKSPEIGIWKANIQTVRVPETGSAYVLMVGFEQSKEESVVLEEKFSRYHYKSYEPIIIKVMLRNDGNYSLKDVSVVAKIFKDHALPLFDTITLFDDGLHNDLEPNDGVYANLYKNPGQEGAYGVTISASGKVNNKEFNRELVTTTVWIEK